MPGMERSFLELFVCPECRGKLFEEGGCLKCVRCSRKYPVKEGVAVLISGEAESDAISENKGVRNG